MTKKIFAWAALLMASATFTACSCDDNIIDEPQQPANPTGTYTMTIEATKGDAATTRALTLSGKTLNATWAEGEAVTVYNVTRSADLSGTLTAQSSGTSTVLKGTLTGTIQNGDQLKLKFLSPDYASQDGTLAYIAAHCDYAKATVTVTDASTPSVTTTAASFVNQQAIVKFTLKNEVGNNLYLRLLKINDGTHTYTVNRSTTSGDPFYVAIPGFSGQTIHMLAKNLNGFYEYVKSGVTFANGQYYEITVKMDYGGHDYVDLGLHSGTLWATCNVGATTPEGYGDYFAWGEVEPYYSSLDPLTWKSGKEAGYEWASYRFENSANHDGSSFSKYTGSDYSVLQPADDAATHNWGANWRMPTNDELQELFDNTNWEWTTLNGINGLKLKKKTDASVYIFFPSAGGINGTSVLENNTVRGGCWSSTDETGTAGYAKKAMFNSSGSANAGCDGWRDLGRPVRAVLSWK